MVRLLHGWPRLLHLPRLVSSVCALLINQRANKLMSYRSTLGLFNNLPHPAKWTWARWLIPLAAVSPPQAFA